MLGKGSRSSKRDGGSPEESPFHSKPRCLWIRWQQISNIPLAGNLIFVPSSSFSFKCALRESGCRTGYEPTKNHVRSLSAVDIQGHQRGGFCIATMPKSIILYQYGLRSILTKNFSHLVTKIFPKPSSDIFLGSFTLIRLQTSLLNSYLCYVTQICLQEIERDS